MRFAETRYRFVSDRRGTTAVEFGLLAIPFFALILFSLQVAIIYFADQTLQTFNENVSRNLLTGITQQAGLSQTQFRTQACAQLPSIFSCGNFYFDVRSYSSFSLADTASPTLTFDGSGNVTNSFQYNPGAPGNIVVVKMMYTWPVVATILGKLSNTSNNTFMLMSVSVFKTEQYS